MGVRFTSKERDSETGLDYFGARYFSAAQDRFTSPDEFKGGILDPLTDNNEETIGPLPYADISDPQTLNKYAYVRNNPLRYVDPDGHCFWDLCIGEGAAAVAMVAIYTGATVVAAGAIYYAEKTGEAIANYINGIPGTRSQAPDINTTVVQSQSKAGTPGKPDHQQTVKEEAQRINGRPEVPIPTPGGKKEGRRADAVGTNPQTGAPEIVQVYRPTPAGNIPKREKDAAADIEGATGIKPTMVPVRPLPPKPPCMGLGVCQ